MASSGNQFSCPFGLRGCMSGCYSEWQKKSLDTFHFCYWDLRQIGKKIFENLQIWQIWKPISILFGHEIKGIYLALQIFEMKNILLRTLCTFTAEMSDSLGWAQGSLKYSYFSIFDHCVTRAEEWVKK